MIHLPLRTLMRHAQAPLRRLRVAYGSKPYCPVCGSFVDHFAEHRGRIAARCPVCGSLERHRLSVRVIEARFGNKPSFQHVLHIAPERAVGRYLRRHSRRGYVTCDLLATNVDVKCDIANTPFCDDEFDLIYCSHVLEHVSDDRAAMRELHRILAPHGLLVVMVPIGRAPTDESPEKAATPELRKQHFGQEDHVRRYGMDIVTRLDEAGFLTEVASTSNEKYLPYKKRYGFMENDHVFCSVKRV